MFIFDQPYIVESIIPGEEFAIDAYYAYGINVYHYFSDKRKPRWDFILKGRTPDVHAMAIIERKETIGQNQFFDYSRPAEQFPSISCLRKMDYRRFPICAFVFFRITREPEQEFERLLALDPRHFVSEKTPADAADKEEPCHP